MTTAYSPSRIANTSAPLTHSATRYSGAAELCAAIRAAALVAPEVAPQIEFMERYAPTFYPHKNAAEFETGSRIWMNSYTVVNGQRIGKSDDVATEGPASQYPRRYIHPESTGPFLPMPVDARVSFAYAVEGVRGSLTVANTAPALRALADKVHAQRAAFDGKAKRAKRPAKPAGSAPHVAARAAWKAGDFEGSINLARGAGPVVFGCGGDKPAIPYMGAEHVRVAGEDWVIARCIQTGEFLALHLDCGLSVGGRFKSHSAALDALESSAGEEAFCEKVRQAVSTLPKFSQAQALAHYMGDDADETAAFVAPVMTEPVAEIAALEPVAATPWATVNTTAADFYQRPCAADGLTSYRCKSLRGWIMIGATDAADAMREARRSCEYADPASLQVWDGTRYVTDESARTFATDEADERASASREPLATVCATTAPLSAALLAHVDASAPVDHFDYLADYAAEPISEDEKAPAAMRAAILADIERTGEALYWSRMVEASTPVPTQPAADPDYRESDEFRDLRYGNEIAAREKADIERAAGDSATRARLMKSAATRYAVSAESAESGRLVRVYRQVSFALGLCADMCGDAADAEVAPLAGLDVRELDAEEAAQVIAGPLRDPMPWPKPVARILPPVRMGRMDPRIRIPARFTTGYALRG